MHGDGGGPQTVVDDAFVRTPNFTPNGRDPPAETPVRTAVGRYLLARREVRGSNPLTSTPKTPQVRASSASSGWRLLHVAAAPRPQAHVAVQPGRLFETRRLGLGARSDHGG
jgi:hypothetical protein